MGGDGVGVGNAETAGSGVNVGVAVTSGSGIGGDNSVPSAADQRVNARMAAASSTANNNETQRLL